MATNKKLRETLLKELGSSPQALSQRIKRFRGNHGPITTENATYVIAHLNRIPIHKYLDPEKVKEVQGLTPRSEDRSGAPKAAKKVSARSNNSSERAIIFPKEFKTTDPLLPPTKLKEAVDMASIYPVLYVLENSIRELIKRVMAANHGADWWNQKMKKGKLKAIAQKATDRMKNETTKNSWHQKRGDHPIDYIDLKELGTIVSSNEAEFFPDIISDKEWFLQFMRELEPSRNVLCHMNPVDPTNLKDVRLKFERWQKMIKTNIANIPK